MAKSKNKLQDFGISGTRSMNWSFKSLHKYSACCFLLHLHLFLVKIWPHSDV